MARMPHHDHGDAAHRPDEPAEDGPVGEVVHLLQGLEACGDRACDDGRDAEPPAEDEGDSLLTVEGTELEQEQGTGERRHQQERPEDDRRPDQTGAALRVGGDLPDQERGHAEADHDHDHAAGCGAEGEDADLGGPQPPRDDDGPHHGARPGDELTQR